MNIICGNDSINWVRLSGAIGVLSNDFDLVADRYSRDCHELGIEDHISLIIDRIYRIQQLKMFNDVAFDGRDRPPLSETLTIARYSDQQDAKDKVYGILSLIDPVISKSIVPDYSLSLVSIYTEFAKTCIRETGSLDIICQSRAELLQTEEFPSWVADWRRRQTVNVEMTQKMPYNASASSESEYKFEQNDTHLRVRGFRVDTIDGLGQLGDDPGEEQKTGYEITQSTQCYDKSPYGNVSRIRAALWQTLVAGRNAWGEVAPTTYECLIHIPWHDSSALPELNESLFFSSLQSIIDENKSFLVGRHTLRELLNLSEKIKYDLPPKAIILEATHRAVTVKLLRRLIVTTMGYIGLVTKNAKVGDVVCILFGCSTPVILRPGTPGVYRIVGDCYVHGLMEGEAMKWVEEGSCSTEYFTII